MMLIADDQFQTTNGFWAAVGLAAAIATALATAASTVTAIWWRYQDRAEAEFSLRLVGRGGRDDRGSRIAAPKLDVIFQNIGDGAAHQVCFSGNHLVEDPRATDSEMTSSGYHLPVYTPLPVMRTGDSIRVSATADSFDAWDNATIQIEWWPPPTRKKKDWFVKSLGPGGVIVR